MPYIPQNERPQYDPLIAQLGALLSKQPPEKRKGHANYVITQILRRGWSATESYSSYADITGTLECAKLEIYRRWIAPYEDRAIEKNGDV